MIRIFATKPRHTPFAVETAPTKIAPDANPVGAALAANPGDSVAQPSQWRDALLMKRIIVTNPYGHGSYVSNSVIHKTLRLQNCSTVSAAAKHIRIALAAIATNNGRPTPLASLCRVHLCLSAPDRPCRHLGCQLPVYARGGPCAWRRADRILSRDTGGARPVRLASGTERKAGFSRQIQTGAAARSDQFRRAGVDVHPRRPGVASRLLSHFQRHHAADGHAHRCSIFCRAHDLEQRPGGFSWPVRGGRADPYRAVGV